MTIDAVVAGTRKRFLPADFSVTFASFTLESALWRDGKGSG
jgi:hypothetical protein